MDNPSKNREMSPMGKGSRPRAKWEKNIKERTIEEFRIGIEKITGNKSMTQWCKI